VPPVRLIELFDEVYDRIGVPMKVTEFDMDGFANEQIEADFMRDFLTVTFAHPNTEAFLSWGFWDGAHFRDNAPFFRRDWSVKPSGQAFFDLVFKEWWTDESLTTDTNGLATVRGYKGDYEIEVSGETKSVKLTEAAQVNFEVSVSSSSGNSLLLNPEVYPNPTGLSWNISSLPAFSEVHLYDTWGRQIAFAKTSSRGEVLFDARYLAKGIYYAKSSGYVMRLVRQ